jgi:hypothetical protein
VYLELRAAQSKGTTQEVGLGAALRSRGTFFCPLVTEQSNGTNNLGSIDAKTKQNRVQNGVQGSGQGTAAQGGLNALRRICGGSLVLHSVDLACDLLHLRLQRGGGRILDGDGRGDGYKCEKGENGELHIE